MNRYLEILTVPVAKELARLLQTSDESTVLDRYVGLVPSFDFSPWNYSEQWGSDPSDAKLLAPIVEARHLNQSYHQAQAADERNRWVDSVLDDLIPLAEDGLGADLAAHPLEFQLYGVELAYTLACALPHWKSGIHFANEAQENLAAVMDYLLDSTGVPIASALPDFRLITASWTRLRLLEAASGIKLFGQQELLLYSWVIRNQILLTNACGVQKFGRTTQVENPPVEIEFFKAMLSLDDDQDDYYQACLALPWIPKNKVQEAKEQVLTDPTMYSSSSGVAVLQDSWSFQASSTVIAYEDDKLQLNVSAGGRTLLDGLWNTNVWLNGKKLKTTGEWTEVCWSNDSTAVYLELECSLERSATLNKTAIFLPEDELLILADAVRMDGCGSTPRNLLCQSEFPLAESVSFVPSRAANEGWISVSKLMRTVIPPSMPEWRIPDQTNGFIVDTNRFTLQTQGQGDGLFLPMVIDLNPRRTRNAFTWRQLTVAQSGDIVPQQSAVGYRIMIGEQQWLIYQSLTETVARTLLGHHLFSQTLVARFDNGQVIPLVEII